MITTVTLNPAIDKMIEVTNFEQGQVHRLNGVVKNLGGKSINVSRILTGLKVENRALCFSGIDNDEEIKHYAQKDQIDLESIVVDGSTRTNIKMIETDQQYRTTDLNEPGFLVNQTSLEKMNQLIQSNISESDYLVLSGSLPEGIPRDYYGEVAKTFKTKTKVIIDADGDILNYGIQGSPYLIKPNIHELESILDKQLESKESIIHAAKEIIEKYGVTYVLVSLGIDGSILVSDEHTIIAESIKVEAVNTVGAGDSMLAGFLSGLEKYKTYNSKDIMIEALKCGVASSSIAISTKEHKCFDEASLTAMTDRVTYVCVE